MEKRNKNHKTDARNVSCGLIMYKLDCKQISVCVCVRVRACVVGVALQWATIVYELSDVSGSFN